MILILGDIERAGFGNQIAHETHIQFVILSHDFIGSHRVPGPTGIFHHGKRTGSYHLSNRLLGQISPTFSSDGTAASHLKVIHHVW